MKKLFNSLFKLQSLVILTMVSGLIACEEVDPPVGPGLDYKTIAYNVSEIEVTRNVVYGVDPSTHLMDTYIPPSNEQAANPLILLSGGGNFGPMSQLDKVKSLAMELARRGYAAAVVEFTQVNDQYGVYPPTNYTMLEIAQAYVQAGMDLKAAVRFFRTNSLEYNIDTQNIFTGGWSTGGSVSLGMATISSLEELALIEDEVLRDAYVSAFNNVGGFEGSSGNPGVSSEVKGVLSMMPQVLDLSLLDASDPALILITHELSKSGISPYQSLLGQVSGECADHAFTTYGHNEIVSKASDLSMSVQSLLVSGGDESKPNSEPLNHYQVIAEMLAPLAQGF